MSTQIDPSKQAAMVFKKSNKLIQSKFSCSIGVNRLLAMSLYAIQEGNFEQKGSKYICSFQASDIAQCTGVSAKGGTYYGQLKKLSYEMSNLKIFTEDFDNRSFVYMSLVTKAEFKNGVLSINFDDEAVSFLRGITQSYTSFEIQSMMQFKSNYAFRIYEWLRSKAFYFKNENRSENPHPFSIKVELSELKFIVGVLDINSDTAKKVIETNLDYPDYELAERAELDSNKDVKYSQWKHFKSRVLDQAVKEINEKSDIYVTYTNDRMKKGEISTTIYFNVEYKQDRERKEKLDKNSVIAENGVEVVLKESDQEKSATKIPDNTETVNKKVSSDKNDSDSKMDQILSIGLCLNEILGEKLSAPDVQAIAEAAAWDLNEIKREAYLLSKNKTEVSNKVGWLISAIQKNYAGTEFEDEDLIIPEETPNKKIDKKESTPAPKKIKNGFINFKGREYDYGELQKQLLLKSMKQSTLRQTSPHQMSLDDYMKDYMK